MNSLRLNSLAPLLVALATLLLSASPAIEERAMAQPPAADSTAGDAEGAQPAADETPAVEGAAEGEGAQSDPPTSSDTPADSPATEPESVDNPASTPDTSAPPSEPSESEAETSAPPLDTEGPPAETPATDEGATPEGESPAPSGDASPAGKEAATDAAAESSTGQSLMRAGRVILMLILTLVFPIVLGNIVGRQLRMPDHAWKLSLVFVTLAIAGYTVATGRYKLGPDLGGGFSLVYDLADTSSDQAKPNMDELRSAIQQRIDPSGQLEVAVRARGNSIEIIMPRAGEAELNRIKRTLTALGNLEFRILVDGASTDRDIEELIEEAKALPRSQTRVEVAGLQAKWVPYKVEEFGGVDEFDPADASPNVRERRNAVKRQGLDGPEILVLLDVHDVTGEYLTSARKGFGIDGPQVQFSFDATGARKFGRLTGENVPDPNTGDLSFLGIILDDVLLSAPSIQSQIKGDGQISGRNMAEEEVEEVVDILNAGSLPAALNKVPVSEETVSPQLGTLTIEQGVWSMTVSTILVLLFMVFYYRFAGIVACLALLANILFVVATMLMFEAAFTLPGLAGLVLTVGMSVDANVLIFERIREEMARGASLRMAIRNGFSRATTTIVDANLTTLITGIVLYVIGTDQIRGFAVTLILGIIMSMYTAIFCSRLIFDIAERTGWLKQLSMMKLMTSTNWKFMNKWAPAALTSLVIVALGVAAIIGRGRDMLNIDFTGGTSVYFVLDEPTDVSVVRDKLEASELSDKNLLVVSRGQTGEANTTFSVDCSVVDVPGEGTTPPVDAVEVVKNVIRDRFGETLRTYQVRADEPRAVEADSISDAAMETTLHFGPADKGAEAAAADASDVDDIDGASYDTVVDQLKESLVQLGHPGVRPIVTSERYTEGSSRRLTEWQVRLELPEPDARAVFDDLVTRLSAEPIFPQANKIGGRVANDMQLKALYAIVISMLGIVGYVWIRFQHLAFGIASVVPLVHDVAVTVSLIAISKYVVEWFPPLASALQIESFQIGLTVVAALLTLIGYSINDTIVVFDRIREIRGKSKRYTAEMMDTAVNQTLSRTILTAGTTLIVVVILYFFGGSGIHAFAFSLLVGVIVGTYSSVFIASPLLLWMTKGRDESVGDELPST
jgi:SecD/SecF fusion protein